MHQWLVTLINTEQPFDTKKVVVKAETISEAFDEFYHGHPKYYARSAGVYHGNEREREMAQPAIGSNSIGSLRVLQNAV